MPTVDADGRAIVFSYNAAGQETGETWYPTAADADAGAGSDGSESFSDFNGNRTSLSATIGTTADFLNSYYYDAIGEVTGITQTSDGGDSVLPKGVSLTYNDDALLTGEQLFNSTDIATAESSGDTTNLVATSTDTYDTDSRLTELTYKAQSSGAILVAYQYAYNADSGVTDLYSYSDTADTTDRSSTYTTWADAHYNYDDDQQLSNTTSGDVTTNAVAYANWVSEPTTDNSLAYDPNGNRTQSSLPDSITSATGAGNRVLYDGTYFYQYDADGNRIAKFKSDTGLLDSSATDITIYKWNEENELTAVTPYAAYSDYSSATDGSETDLRYDPFGDMVSETSGGATQYFIYDGQNVVLVFNVGTLIQRQLDGLAADQVLAVEEVGGENPGVNWLLADAQGSVRDVVRGTYSDGATTTAAVDHVFLDAFGDQATPQSATDSQDQTQIGFAGMRYIAAVELYMTPNRPYDPSTGDWLEPDPAGFDAGQTNLFEYCGNSPTNATDPSGLMANFSQGSAANWGPLKGTDIGGVGNCGCGKGYQVGLPADSGGGTPISTPVGGTGVATGGAVDTGPTYRWQTAPGWPTRNLTDEERAIEMKRIWQMVTDLPGQHLTFRGKDKNLRLLRGMEVTSLDDLLAKANFTKGDVSVVFIIAHGAQYTQDLAHQGGRLADAQFEISAETADEVGKAFKEKIPWRKTGIHVIVLGGCNTGLHKWEGCNPVLRS